MIALAPLALALVVGAQAAPPPAPTLPGTAPTPVKTSPVPKLEPDTLVLVDDRATKDQAPAAFIERVIAEIDKRKGMRALRISQARKALEPREDKALQACGDDAGCLATAAREMGGRLVVFARLTKREGAFFVALTRVNALRPQASDDTGTLAGTDTDALAAIPEAVAELFPEAELKSP